MPPTATNFAQYLADLPDPRVDRARWHRLDDILVITLCAAIRGADGFEEIERFGKARRDWPKGVLELPEGTPRHDTFDRVLAALDRDEFSACFARRMADPCAATGLRATAVDGEACRAAPGDTFSGCPHLVNAWAVANHPLLGQVAVADGGHQITAMPELLRVRDLKGAPVTADAAGCQTGIIRPADGPGGDSPVAVRGNQPASQRAVRAAFDRACGAGFGGCPMAATAEDGHGRHGERDVTAVPTPAGVPGGWADVRAVAAVGRERVVGGGRVSAHHCYLTRLRHPAGKGAGCVRGHRGVENGLHGCRDVSFGEDANRTRDANAGANLGVIRRVAASLLKQDGGKGRIKAKRRHAALDHDYLQRVLQGFRAN